MLPMTWASALTGLVLLTMVVALVREWAAPSIVVIGAMIVLLISGIISTEQAFAGFSNPAPITVAALYILARGVEKTGALQPLVAGTLDPHRPDRWNLARLLVPTASASAFLNNTPIVAMLVPQVSAWASRWNRPVGLFLLPISFAAILGGTLTLIGTSTNLVISGLLEASGEAPIGMFELTAVAFPAALGGLVFLIVLTPLLLPHRRGLKERFEEDWREFVVEMTVVSGGAAEGRTVEEAGLRNLKGVFLARVDRGGRTIAPVSPDEVLQEEDELQFVGRADLIVDLLAVPGLVSSEHKHTESYRDATHAFYEVVVSSISPLTGRTLKEANFREQYQSAVLAIHRAGERVRGKLGEISLKAGDTLLILSDAGFVERWRHRRDFLLVSRLDGALPTGTRKAVIALGVVGSVVLLAGIGVLPILKGALLGAIALVGTRVLTPNEARNAVDLDVVLLIAAAFGVGNAIQSSGLADLVAGRLVNGASALGPVAVLAAVALVTLILTELITNNAAAVLMFPVGVAAAVGMGLDPRPFAIVVALTASASFLSPIGYQTNTMVYGPGGYRFTDFARLGLPITLLFTTGVVLLTALKWNLI